MIATNLGGAFHVCQAAARRMLRRRRGSIVTMSSIVGIHGNAGQTNYSASKAGLIGLTKSLAKEIGSRGVRVNCIAPGLHRHRADATCCPTARARRLLASTPLGRLGEPEDVARCVRFLVSDAAELRDGRGARGRRRIGDVAVALRQPGGRRVVLTGIGMVTPLGNTREDTWDGIVAGRSGGAPITIFPLRDAPVRFACEVKDFDPTVAMDRKLARRTDRYTQFVLVAAREAIEDAELDVTAEASASAPARPSRPASAACRRSTSRTSTSSRRASIA